MTSTRVVVATSWHHSAVARQVHHLAERLSSRGIEVHLIDDRGHDLPLPPAFTAIHRWPEPSPASLRNVRWAHDLIRRLRPAAVIANFAAVGPLGPAALAARVPARFCWYHTILDANRIDAGGALSWRMSARRCRRTLAYRCYTDLVATSGAAAEDYRRWFGTKGPRVHIHHNAVIDGPHRLRPPSPDAPIVCVGRLDPTKGQDVLVRAMGMVRTDRPLLLLGEGEQHGALSRLADEVGARVVFGGQTGIDQVRSIVAEAALAVVPSRAEAFGLTAAEALAAGVPLIASDVGGLSEVAREGVTGRLVPPDDPVALAAAIEEVLDPERNVEFGRAGREDFLRRFEVGRWAADVDGLLGDLT